jgi:hypothetical protein
VGFDGSIGDPKRVVRVSYQSIDKSAPGII